MIKKITVVALLTFVSACSSSTPGYSEKSKANDEKYAQMAKDKNMVCEYRPTTGSHRKKQTCMSKELADEIRRKNQEALRSQKSNGRTRASSNI
tara:strand:- start:16599 stop:16880 length:282 start_codon:yes stop_codon:yes gene_type:complete